MGRKGYYYIPDDGTEPRFVESKKLKLEDLQALVKGHLELVPSDLPITIYVNDEGKILGMKPTLRTPEIADDYIVGPVVILGGLTRSGNDRLLDESMVPRVLEHITLLR